MTGRLFLYFAVFIAAGVLISGCGTVLEKPEISVSGIDVASLSLSSVTLNITFSIDNPNPVGITLSSISFDVYSKRGNDWEYLASGRKEAIEISPGKNEVAIPVVVSNLGMISSLAGSYDSGEIAMRVSGLASTELLGIDVDIPFTRSFTIPLNIPWK